MKKIIVLLLLTITGLILTGCSLFPKPEKIDIFTVDSFNYDRESKEINAFSSETLQTSFSLTDNVKHVFSDKYDALTLDHGTLHIPNTKEYTEGEILLAYQTFGKVLLREYRFLYLSEGEIKHAVADFEFENKFNDDQVLKSLQGKKIEEIQGLFSTWEINPELGKDL